MARIKNFKVNLKSNELLSVRNAEAFDAEKIIKIMKEIMIEKIYMIHEIDELHDTSNDKAAQIRKFNNAEGKLFLVAEIQNKIAGYLTFNNWDTRKTMHTGFLSLYISKDWRNRGIGKILLKTLINWAKKNKVIKKMSLAVFSSNKNAIKLYKKMGFKIEGICPKDIRIGKRFYDTIFMYIFT